MEPEPLPSIERLSPRVLRVLGQNPGRFTLQGTNTYLVGQLPPWILVDVGERGLSPAYLVVLERAIREHAGIPNKNNNGNNLEGTQLVSDIVITHRHGDHHGGLPGVLKLLRRLWGPDEAPNGQFPAPKLHLFPSPITEPQENLEHLRRTVSELPAQHYQVPPPNVKFPPFFDLYDQQTLYQHCSDTSTALNIIHTPGHTTDSVCLYLPAEKTLFTADSVLGQGTSIFEDLTAYLASLQKISDTWGGDKSGPLYPGHGPVVQDGKGMIESYIKHRLEREREIVELLKSSPRDPEASDRVEEYWTTLLITKILYHAYPREMWPLASRNILQHLMKLEGEGRVRRIAGSDDGWELIAPRL